jgi:hypothetical protein
MIGLKQRLGAFALRHDRALFLTAMGILIIGFGLVRSFYLPEGDIFWEIRAGQDTLSTGMIPRVAHWAWIIDGRPWLPNSWLWNVLLALVYNAGGFTAIGWLNFLFFVIIFGLAWNLIRILDGSRALQFNLSVLIFVASFIWLTIRPQEADYTLLLIFLNVVVYALRKPKILWWCMPLVAYVVAALWQNFHLTGSLAVVLLPAGFWFLHAFLTKAPWRQRLLPTILIGVATLLGLLSTPFGIEAITKSGEVLDASRGILLEWSPINFALPTDTIVFVSILLFGVGPLILAIRTKQWLYVVFLVGFVVLSYDVVRFAQYLAFFNLIALPLLPKPKVERSIKPSAYLGISLFVLALGVYIATPRLTDPNGLLLFSSQDLHVVPSGTRVLTTGGAGSQIILTRPDLSPSLDSRNDIYGRKDFLYLNHLLYWNRSAPIKEFIEREHVGAVYIQNAPESKDFTIQHNMRELGWREVKQADSVIFLPPTS